MSCRSVPPEHLVETPHAAERRSGSPCRPRTHPTVGSANAADSRGADSRRPRLAQMMLVRNGAIVNIALPTASVAASPTVIAVVVTAYALLRSSSWYPWSTVGMFGAAPRGIPSGTGNGRFEPDDAGVAWARSTRLSDRASIASVS